MGKKLETTVNVAILLTCGLVLTAMVPQLWSRLNRDTVSGNAPPAGLSIGSQLPPLPGVTLQEAERTLVIVLKEQCNYCTASLPFYSTLASDNTIKRPPSVSLVILTTDPMSTARAYADRNGLKTAAIVSLPQAQVKKEFLIPGTPTLLLVNRSGRIERMWVGQLDSAGEQEVRSALFAAG